jgi:lipopolysaccharide biosynthesis glycosyltransferase
MTFYPCDVLANASLDRVLLPLLLADVERAVCIAADTLVLDDIGMLAQLDLEGHPLAARDTRMNAADVWRQATSQLPGELADELRRLMAARHGFGKRGLNAAVLVLDLERMRRDNFAGTYAAWVDRYRLRYQQVLLAYAASDRVHLEPRWNALPAVEDVHNPGIINWFGLGKPWEPQLTFAQEQWRTYESRLRRRLRRAAEQAA